MRFQTNDFQHSRRALHAKLPRYAAKRQRQSHVFQRRIVRHEVERLKDEPDMFLPKQDELALRHALEVLANNDDFACRHFFQPGEDVEQRGFTRTAPPDDRADLTLFNLQIDAAQRFYRHGADMIIFFDAANVDQRVFLHEPSITAMKHKCITCTNTPVYYSCFKVLSITIPAQMKTSLNKYVTSCPHLQRLECRARSAGTGTRRKTGCSSGKSSGGTPFFGSNIVACGAYI
ncbi:hypothetical protein SDC9_165573 [bioreactor metagenome]|uniref:Uncharacterized protein n=1 Tax=bioreactor metagenome TaxID=1076179 RepID=A0A645G250_9ZZZZ